MTQHAIPSRVFFISDTHFGHRNIAEYCGRPTNHEELMWKFLEIVQPEDTLVHIGDVSFGMKEEVLAVLNRLPGGVRILVEGNHDTRNKYVRRWDGWEQVTRYKRSWSFEKEGLRITATHRPQDFTESCDADIRIHGHTHEKGVPFRWAYRDGKRFLVVNVCVEQIGYAPIEWGTILERYRADESEKTIFLAENSVDDSP
jgi:calcineurin-like phosphoesterase family protein